MLQALHRRHSAQVIDRVEAGSAHQAVLTISTRRGAWLLAMEDSWTAAEHRPHSDGFMVTVLSTFMVPSSTIKRFHGDRLMVQPQFNGLMVTV